MNDHAWTGQITAPLAITVGVLACFWGYRILKLIIGITGFIAGAAGGWWVAAALAPGHNGIALACSVAGGILGAVLCLWLFLVGIFVLGASAGAVVAAAVFRGLGHQPQPILFLVVVVAFGLMALLLRKFMIVVSTSFSGSYLITAGLLQFVTGRQTVAPLWFAPLQPGSAGLLGYAELVLWLVLALVGAKYQYRSRRRRDEAARHQAQPA